MISSLSDWRAGEGGHVSECVSQVTVCRLGLMIGGLHLMTKLFTVELEIFSDKKDIMMHDITINTVKIQ